MVRRCADLYLCFRRSGSLSWKSNHLCWRHLNIGFFLCIFSNFSSVHYSVSVLVLAVVSAVVVVCTSWWGILLVDDYWMVFSCIFVTLPENRCPFFLYLFCWKYLSWLTLFLVSVSLYLSALAPWCTIFVVVIVWWVFLCCVWVVFPILWQDFC